MSASRLVDHNLSRHSDQQSNRQQDLDQMNWKPKNVLFRAFLRQPALPVTTDSGGIADSQELFCVYLAQIPIIITHGQQPWC